MRPFTTEPAAYASFASHAPGGGPELVSLSPHAAPGGQAGRLVNFANIIHIFVVGNPSEQQLGGLEDHIRGLYCYLASGRVLRELQGLAQAHGSYPVIVFDDAAPTRHAMLERARTARPGEPIDSPSRDDASLPEGCDEDPGMIRLIAAFADDLLRVQQATKTREELLEAVVSLWPDAPAPAEPTRSRSPRPLPVLRTLPETSWRPPMGLPVAGSEPREDRPSQAVAHYSWHRALLPWLKTEANTVADEWRTLERDADTRQEREGIRAFKDFLVLLAVTDVHRHPGQHAEVAKWLHQAALPESAQLRAEAFEACIEAAGSCQDGALSTWNKLSMLAIEADVREGRYQGRLADLHSVARSIFRMRELETIASAKVEQLYEQEQRRREEAQQGFEEVQEGFEEVQQGFEEIIDPVETYLGYQVALRDALDLPIPVTRMYFSDMAQLTEKDINQALEAIQQAEKERFAAWLLLDFDPFLGEVRHQLGPEASAEITNAAIEAYEATSKHRIPQRLQALGLPDNDIEHQKISVQLSREILYAAWLPHANEMLAAANVPLLPALDKDETRRTGLLPDGALMV